jgi:hypothetical protein
MRFDRSFEKMWCNCGESARPDAPRGADFDPSQCPDLVIRLERTTGFEPATPTLARSSGAIQLPAYSPIAPPRWALSTNHSEPRLTVFVKGVCVFCGAHITDFRTTCTTSAPVRWQGSVLSLRLNLRLPADTFLQQEFGSLGVNGAYLIEQGANAAVVSDPPLIELSFAVS